jgi:succinate dehydrogenase / fumarate reductase iron-sulfur subunit
MQAGGFVSVNTGNAPEANALPVSKEIADLAMDAAACIGCGACVAVCKNASAMLFVAAKVSHLNYLPQGKAEKDRRVKNMVSQMDKEGFGNCTVTGSCEAVCPKEISLDFIAKMNRDYAVALVKGELKKSAPVLPRMHYHHRQRHHPAQGARRGQILRPVRLAVEEIAAQGLKANG